MASSRRQSIGFSGVDVIECPLAVLPPTIIEHTMHEHWYRFKYKMVGEEVDSVCIHIYTQLVSLVLKMDRRLIAYSCQIKKILFLMADILKKSTNTLERSR